MRNHSGVDHIIMAFDHALRALTGHLPATRPCPAACGTTDDVMNETEKRHAAALMRVNHAGEVCAQALYQGQSITAEHTATKAKLRDAQHEEIDHLVWCRARVHALGGQTSYLDPLWYVGALSIGMACGLLGDAKNLGFLAETERQVVDHLNDHLSRLPDGDAASRAIIQQMLLDEQEHADTAVDMGGETLPPWLRWTMLRASRIMTTTAYYI